MNQIEKCEIQDINAVKLRGFIVGKYSPNPAIVILTLCIPSSKSQIANYPQIAFFGDNKVIAESFNVYDNVEIEAVIQTRRKVKEGKKIYTQNIVGKTIKETERTLSAAFNSDIGGQYLPPENIFRLKGTIRAMYLVTDNVLEITVETKTDIGYSFVKLYKYGTKVKSLMTTLTIGAPVFVLGEVHTFKKVKNGDRKFYENMTISEIFKQNSPSAIM